MQSRLGEVSLFELEILRDLGHHHSLRALGRAKRLEPPHLSKILSRLEAKLACPLVKRSPKGFLLTPEGLRLVKQAREILALAEGLAPGVDTEVGAPVTLTVAASRFVAVSLLAPLLEPLRSGKHVDHFRLIDMAPDEVTSAAMLSACEVVVTVGEPTLTRAWATTKVGALRWGLFASRRHPLAARVTEDALRPYPFIVPTYWKAGIFETGDDYCPMPWRSRRRGDEASSVLLALEILQRSPEQLLFGPRLVMRSRLARRELREIQVPAWGRVEKPLYLSVKSAVVSKRIEERLLANLIEAIQ